MHGAFVVRHRQVVAVIASWDSTFTGKRATNSNRECRPTYFELTLLRGFATFIALECLIAGQLYLAHTDNFLTISEMRNRGIPQGLPLAWHLGIWGDVFVISILAAIIVSKFSDRWSWRDILLIAGLMLPVTSALAWIFGLSNTPEAHIHDDHFTPAGVIHLIYMFASLSVLTLFFLCTPNVSKSLLLITGGLIIIHLLLGTHMVLGVIDWITPLDWYPDRPLKSASGWAIIGGFTAALALRVTLFDTRTAPLAMVLAENNDLQTQERFAGLLEQSIKSSPIQDPEARAAKYRKARQGLRTLKACLLSNQFESLESNLDNAIKQVEAKHSDRYRLLESLLV